MKKIIAFFAFLIGCSSANSQSCDLCGNWSFDRFEYAGYITTDCEGTARQFFNGTSIIVTDNHFAKTYSTDNSANMFDNVNFIYGDFDSDENAQVIIVKTEDKVIEKLYKLSTHTIYLSLDGCHFYFTRN